MTTLRASMGSGLNRVPRWVYVAIALLLAILFPLLEQAGLMDPVWMRVGTRTLVYVMLAIGLNVVMGETGLLNLGYVAFFAVGAYTTAIFASPRFGYEIPFFLLLVLSALAAMVLGGIVGLPTLRLRGDYLAIVTLAFGEITRHAFNNLDTVTNGPGGIPGIFPPNIAHEPEEVAHRTRVECAPGG